MLEVVSLDAEFLVSGKRAGIGFPLHGTGYIEDLSLVFRSLGCKLAEVFVLITKDEADVQGNQDWAQAFHRSRIIRYLVFHDGMYLSIPDNTSVMADDKTKAGNDVVDTFTCGSRFMDTSVTLCEQHAEGGDIFGGDVAFAPDVELAMKGKETAVKDIGLSFRHTCNSGIDNCWITIPGHANRQMVICY